MMRTVLIVILALTLHGCYLLGPYGDDKRYWKADGTNYGMDYDNTPIIGPAVCVGTYEACKPYFTEVPASQTTDRKTAKGHPKVAFCLFGGTKPHKYRTSFA